MLSQERIERINYLAKKAKIEELSEEEKQEQKQLRQAYLKNLRVSLKNQLDNIEIVD